MRALLTISRLTLQEALRARLVTAVGGTAAALVLTGLWLRELSFGVPELRLLLDCGFGAISVGGTLLAVVGTTHLLFSDLAGRRLHLLLARPVDRAVYLGAKLAGVLGVLALYAGTLVAVLLAVLWWWADGTLQLVPWRDILVGGALLWVKLAVVASLATLVCSFAGTALFASVATFGLVLAGHLKPVLGNPSGATAPDLARIALAGLPDLQAFEPTGRLAEAGASAGGVAAYGAAFVVLTATAAMLAFRHREI